MTFVVTDNCKGCRFTDCVAVCPVECFHGDDEMLYINPDECIDCGACVPECPSEAIFSEDDLPEKWKEFTALNAEYAKKWPNISAKKNPPADADQWKSVEKKKDKLSPNAP